MQEEIELEELLEDLNNPEFAGDDMTKEEIDALLDKLDNLDVQVDEQTMSSVNTATSVKQVIKEIEDPNYLAQKELVEKDILKYFDDPQFPTAQEKAFMLENLDDFWFGKWYDERMELYDEFIGLDKDLISDVTSSQMERGRQDVKNMFKDLEMTDLSKKDFQEQLLEVAEDPNLNQTSVRNLVDGDFEEKRMEALQRDDPLIGDIEMEPLQERVLNLTPQIGENNIKMFNIEQGSRVVASEGFDSLPSFGWDLIPSAGEFLEMAPGMAWGLATGALGGAAVYALVEGLTPIIRSLTDLNWIKHPGDTAEHLKAVQETRGLLHMYGGQYIEANQKINNYFKQNITYVWFKDDEKAKIPGAKDQYGPDIGWYYNARQAYTTNLWIRGRVLYMEGTRLGFTESPCELCMVVKVGLGFLDATPNDKCFWVSDRTTILKDTIEVQHALNTHNLAHLIFRDVTTVQPTENVAINPVAETRDEQMYRLLHPEGDEDEKTDVAFGTAGHGEIQERQDADDDIRHMFMSTGQVITHEPEKTPTELHVGDRVKVVSGLIRTRSGEMHGVITKRLTNNYFLVNLDKEGFESGVKRISGTDLAKELPNWSRYHDAKGKPLRIGDEIRRRGHTMEIGSFYKQAGEDYALDPDENMSMMLSQSYLVQKENISHYDMNKIERWTEKYDEVAEKPPKVAEKPPKVVLKSVEPQPAFVPMVEKEAPRSVSKRRKLVEVQEKKQDNTFLYFILVGVVVITTMCILLM